MNPLTNTNLISHVNAHARRRLLAGLALLPETPHQRAFRFMYWKGEDALTVPLDGIIQTMPLSTLDWALTQTENSLKKLGLQIPQSWTPEAATAAAHAAGFAGTSWIMGPEELALLLNRALK